MADCKPDKRIRKHGGEIWTCRCGTVGVTFNGVTVRYSPRDFKKLTKLIQVATTELMGVPAEPPVLPGTNNSSLH